VTMLEARNFQGFLRMSSMSFQKIG